jgi:prepilin signal peptidase PulO-like enzyme (type II secretory pathway)
MLRTRGPGAEENISMTSSAINMYVFIFAFASAFLLGQKRPMLALSTRALLAVLLGLALGYAVAVDQWYRSYLGVATLVANVLFIAFAAIDFINWQKKRLEDRG